MEGMGDELRLAREARGESVEDAAHALRVDPRHLEALERGDVDALPKGPFAAGWLRSYRRHLGLPIAAEAAPSVRRLDPDRMPLWAVRAVAGGMAAIAVLAAVLYLLPATPVIAPAPVAEQGTADQHVAVLARVTTPVEILVDGAVVYDGTLPGGEEVEVSGHRRVEVRLTAAEAARVRYNGERVEPQGRQDLPRRLVFIDDVGAED